MATISDVLRMASTGAATRYKRKIFRKQDWSTYIVDGPTMKGEIYINKTSDVTRGGSGFTVTTGSSTIVLTE